MDKRRFPVTMLAGQADFNALHDLTESGLATVIRALGNASTDVEKILFASATPTVVGAGPWVVTVPAQPIAIAGVPGLLASQDLTVPGTGDRDVALFLRIYKQDVSEARNYLNASATPPAPAAGTTSFVVEQDDVVEAVLVDPYTGPADDLDAVAADVGPPLKYAVLTASGANLTVDHDPEGYLWVIPTNAAPGAHAASHLPGGGDAIDLATRIQDGLIAMEDMVTVREALTDLAIAGTSPYLVRTITGDNEPDPKTVELELRTAARSFKTVTEEAQQKLGLNFQSGGSAGVSEQPARADHKHDMAASPVQIAVKTLVIDTPGSQLGSLIQVEVPASIAYVTAVSVAWAPPNVAAPYYPQVEAAWTHVQNTTQRAVGAKYQLKGARDLWLQLGDYALCEIAAAELAGIVTAAGGSVTWAAASLGALWPTTGVLTIRLIGVRAGVSL